MPMRLKVGMRASLRVIEGGAGGELAGGFEAGLYSLLLNQKNHGPDGPCTRLFLHDSFRIGG